MFAPASRYLTAVARRGGHDLALSEIHSDLRSDEWYDIASGKGVLVLAELRAIMGDKPFDKFMDEFGRAHAGRPVSSAAFFEAAEKAHGKPLGDLKAAWLNGDALSKLSADARARKASGRFWSVDSFERQLDKTVIVYGTIAEADSQREAAGALQRKLASRWANTLLPIKADNDVTDSLIKDSHILLVGRPATNRLIGAAGQGLAGRFRHRFVYRGGRDLRASPDGDRRGGPESRWPPIARSSIFAGLSAEATWLCPRHFPDHGGAGAEVLLMENGGSIRPLAVPIAGNAPGIAAATP